MSMDYKHRVPGYRNRQLRKSKRKGPWVATGVAVAVGAVALSLLALQFFFRDAETSTEPAERKTTHLPAPPMSANPSIRQQPKAVKPESNEAKVPESAKKAEQQGAAPQLAEPRFSFYKILPEKEVIIPESEIKTIKRAETLGSRPAGDVYILQAGSFANPQDAERLRTQLAQLKVKAKIENVKIENAIWYRVRIGPFDSLVGADKVRGYLRSKQIDSVVQKATRNK